MKEDNKDIMETVKASKPIKIGSEVAVNCNTDLDKKEITPEAKEKNFIVIQENADKTYYVAHDIFKFRVNSFDINVVEN